MILPFLLGGLSGTLIGFLVKSLLSKKTSDSAAFDRVKQELELEKERASRYINELSQRTQELKLEREHLLSISNEKASLSANYKNLQERFLEQKKEMSDLQKQFTDQFKNLANDIFEEKNRQNKTNMGELINPLKEKIEKFEKRVEESSKESLNWNSRLSEQVKSLKELNQVITREAENLTKALKGDTKSQGNWGEMQLESILSKAGLERDIHYF
ncbi:MAG: DNA recombination protein RmuC, partial [Cyclobacteriaceae bacterium]|nr:DNA recombination protein RmuC [Cyclobacteriaceae bacterium]